MVKLYLTSTRYGSVDLNEHDDDVHHEELFTDCGTGLRTSDRAQGEKTCIQNCSSRMTGSYEVVPSLSCNTKDEFVQVISVVSDSSSFPYLLSHPFLDLDLD